MPTGKTDEKAYIKNEFIDVYIYILTFPTVLKLSAMLKATRREIVVDISLNIECRKNKAIGTVDPMNESAITACSCLLNESPRALKRSNASASAISMCRLAVGDDSTN